MGNKKYKIQSRGTDSSKVQQTYPPFRENKSIERNKTLLQVVSCLLSKLPGEIWEKLELVRYDHETDTTDTNDEEW